MSPEATQIQSSDQYAVEEVKAHILTIRGTSVILDRDLAAMYQVSVSQMNRQVKRNQERFPEDFMFQLTKEEVTDLKCHFGTSNKRGGDRRARPYAFTEQGIAMLSGLLRSETAIRTNILIMRAFVAMRHYFTQQSYTLQRLTHIEQKQKEQEEWRTAIDTKVEALLENMSSQQMALPAEQLFQTGCVWDAWAYLSDLVRQAQQRIVLVDNFADERTLSLLGKRAAGVSATLFSRYGEGLLIDLDKYNAQHAEILFHQLPHRTHDRFLIIDDVAYLLGASVKDMGTGLCAVTRMTASPEEILSLVQ